MLVQGDGKTLRSVKCFIREEKLSEPKTEQLGEKTGSGNPFIPGGAISEDGALILELWRLDRLGQYGNNCQQVTSLSLSPSLPP